jgi:uncharacterized membrane protein
MPRLSTIVQGLLDNSCTLGYSPLHVLVVSSPLASRPGSGMHESFAPPRHRPSPGGDALALPHGRRPGRPGAVGRWLERFALWIVVGFSAASVVGFATFGLRPELLGRFPGAVPFYAISFRLFAQGQILVAFGALALLLLLRAPPRWIVAFVAVYLVSLGSELSGTAIGFPFGPYHYTALLGPKWFGLVPLVIPLSWFMMAIPSFHLARWADPEGGGLSRVALGTLILSAWDLALDPAMSHATFYWRWEVEGAYYGMPWVNLAGWIFTSALVMSVLVRLRSEAWISRLPGRWLAVFYATNVLLPLGMAAAAGLGWAVAATLAAYAGLGAFAWSRSGRTAGHVIPAGGRAAPG